MPQPSMDLGIPKKEKAFTFLKKIVIFLIYRLKNAKIGGIFKFGLFLVTKNKSTKIQQ